MNSTQDEMTLACVQEKLAAGLIRIDDQTELLDAVLGQGGTGHRERIDLWALESAQARLCSERSAALNRIALRDSALVVLVVEDEPIVMMSTVDNLTWAGFAVIQACSADEAIETLERDDSIGAIFTDIQMPGSMNGLALARLVRVRWPHVRIIVTSGDERFGQRDLAAGERFLAKPYLAGDVVAALRAN